MLSLQGGVDRVFDVDLVNCVMNLRALALDAYEEVMHTGGRDFIHLGIAEGGAELPGKSGGLVTPVTF